MFRHSVWISVADAKARGIKDGDLVRVYNQRGEVVMPAYVTSRESPGTACIYPHSQYDPNKAGVDRGGNCNTLNDDNLQAGAAGQEACNALVEIEKF